MHNIRLIISIAALLLLCGCPPPAKKDAGSGTNGNAGAVQQTTKSTAKPLRLALLSSDLGIADGQMVRELDTLFTGRAASGSIEYSLVGPLPGEIAYGQISGSIGFPDAESTTPGSMTDLQAGVLLDSVPDCDWLVLTSGYVLQHALDRISQGTVNAGAIILVEEAGSQGYVNSSSVPVYILRFDICHAAFMAGAAAARSSNIAHFMLLGAEDDPQAQEYMDAAIAGMQYISPSAWIKQAILPVDSRGLISLQQFRQAHVDLLNEAGENFKTNHYVLDLTRSTPFVTTLISEPGGSLNGYVASAYGDIRHVAESRILTCSLKRADVALAWLLDNCSTTADLAGCAVGSYIDFGLASSRPGLTESAVGYSKMEFYSRYNPDGPDIELELEVLWGEIEAGELGLDYCPH